MDRAGVRGAPSEALQVRLAGLREVLARDRGERYEVDVVDLDPDLGAAIGAANLDLRSRPKAV